jgi:aminoglycoside phosphotransferase (APT) family kinase protein
MAWSKPETDEIRSALRRYAPELAEEPIEFLSEGWEFWAFTAGDHVLRFPRPIVDLHRLPEGTTNLRSLDIERALLPMLAEVLSIPVPRIDIYGEDGPNGAAFAGHKMLPGEPVLFARGAPGPNLGLDYGRLLRELRAFDVEQAIRLGVPYLDGTAVREQRGRHYEQVIRRVFPLVSCEARTYIEQGFESYLNDPANFDFEPSLVHQDLDMNCLIDTATGELSGVIDFGGSIVSNPAMDLWLPLYGFARLGIEDQLPACLEAAGIDADSLARMRPEVDFIDLNFPLTDILSGLDRDDRDQVEEGILALNEKVPFGIQCAP